MSRIPYTYCVIRYLHDPAAGETLNIGVLLYAPAARFAAVRLQQRYERLSHTFSDFDGDHYRRTLRELEAAIEGVRHGWNPRLFESNTPPADALALGTQIWPDRDLGFQWGPLLAGVSTDLPGALDELYQRMVASQQPVHHTERRSDDLKAVNPHKKDYTDPRTVDEILDLIEVKGREVADALAELRRMTSGS